MNRSEIDQALDDKSRKAAGARVTRCGRVERRATTVVRARADAAVVNWLYTQ